MKFKSQDPFVYDLSKALEEYKPHILICIYFCNICKIKIFLYFFKERPQYYISYRYLETLTHPCQRP